ncbi:MAG: sensor histidine kinase [Candidatus Eisenbacteria bacterium]|nr:sensor histidine kinase [Candidatus Eisenbacteria bacterium]
MSEASPGPGSARSPGRRAAGVDPQVAHQAAPRPRQLLGIRFRIFLTLAVLAAALLLGLAVLIEVQARRALEDELDRRLRAVGGAAVSLIGPSLVPGLLALTPAHESFRLYQERRQSLIQLRDRTGVRRIFLADPSGRSFVDTDTRITIGVPLPQLRSDRPEVQRALAGGAAAGPLYTDEGGEFRKTGYVPIDTGGKVIALVGVEADAEFLQALRALRRRLALAGAGAVLLAFLLAAVAARGLTRPLDRLVDWSRGLGRGDLSVAVPVTGGDEIGLLARTLEQMRVEIEARDREQRAMVAGVAHEIRNPLGGIRLYAELLQGDASLNDGQRRRLEKILRELDHMGAVVDQFLLYARPANPIPQALDVAHEVEELADLLRGMAEGRQVALDAPVRAARAQCDPTHLRQVLHNLVRNAIEASPPGGAVRISVGAGDAAADPPECEIAVEDSGPGIPEAVRERLFEPFFTTKTAGAGLGLAIVQRLVLLNRGRIRVDRGETGGARFVLTLPAA